MVVFSAHHILKEIGLYIIVYLYSYLHETKIGKYNGRTDILLTIVRIVKNGRYHSRMI